MLLIVGYSCSHIARTERADDKGGLRLGQRPRLRRMEPATRPF